MLEVIRIIVKTINALLPVVWLISWFLYLKKNKWEKVCAVSTGCLIALGILECVIDGADLICMLLGW